MAKLTDSDIQILQNKAEQIDWGSIEIEFKNGECLAIAGKDRALTKKGKDNLNGRNKSKTV